MATPGENAQPRGSWRDRTGYTAPVSSWRERQATNNAISFPVSNWRDKWKDEEEKRRRREEQEKREQEYLASEEGQAELRRIEKQLMEQAQQEARRQEPDYRRAQERANIVPDPLTDYGTYSRAQEAMDLDAQLQAEYDRLEKERQDKIDEAPMFSSRGKVASFFLPRALEAKDQQGAAGQGYVLREARQRSKEKFQQDLVALGVPEDQLDLYSGIDPEVYQDIVNELASDPLAVQGARKTKHALGSVYRAMFENEYDIRYPFGKEEQTGKVTGIHSAILMDFFFRDIVEILPRAAYTLSADARALGMGWSDYVLEKNGIEPKEYDWLPRTQPTPFLPERIGLTPERLGYSPEEYAKLPEKEKKQIADKHTRFMNYFTMLEAKYAQKQEEQGLPVPDRPYGKSLANGFAAAFHTYGLDLLDYWMLSDLTRLGAGGLTKSVAKNRFIRMQTNLEAVGLSRSEIARLSDMTEEEVANLIRERVTQRFDDILAIGDDGLPTKNPRFRPTEGATLEQINREQSEMFNRLVREGQITEAQALEMVRLINSMGQLGYAFQSGELVGISLLMQQVNRATRAVAGLGGQARTIGQLPRQRFAEFQAAFKDPRFSQRGAIGPMPDDMQKRIDDFKRRLELGERISPEDFDQMAFDYENRAVLLPDDLYTKFENDGIIANFLETAAENGLNVGRYFDAEENFMLETNQFGTQSRELAEQIAKDEANLRARREDIIDAVPPLREDGALTENILNLNISQNQLQDLINDIQSSAAGTSIPDRVGREFLNTPIENFLAEPRPISRVAPATSDDFARAVLAGQDEILANFADIARQFDTPSAFANLYRFIDRPRSVPEVDYPGKDIFNSGFTKEEAIAELQGIGFLTEDEIASLIRTTVPVRNIDVPSAERLNLIEEAEQGEALERMPSAPDELRQYLGDAIQLRRLLNTFREPTPEQVIKALSAVDSKPNIPIFALQDNGRLTLINGGERVRQTVAAARAGGIETIPGYVIDYKGNLSKMKDLLKEQGLTLEQFAQKARGLTPSLVPKTRAKSPAQIAEQRIESGLLSGRLQALGTSPANSVIVPSKFIRQPVPTDEPVLFNNMLARDRFNVPELPIAGLGGATRDVFALGPDAVVKIAKNKEGIIQNLQSYNYHAITQGLIPRIFEGGQNYLIAERFAPLPATGKATQALQDFMESWNIYTKNVEPPEPMPLPEMGYSAQDIQNITNQWDEYVFNFMEEWLNSDEFFAISDLYNWEELARYRVAISDLMKESSWGVRPDGRLVLIDEAALNVDAIYLIRQGSEQGWNKYIKNFDNVVRGSRAAKKAYGDFDPRYNYAVVPGFEEDEEGNYNFDPFQTAINSAFASLGMKKWGGKRPKAQQLRLPPAPNRSLQPKGIASKAIMNSDAWAAKSGQAYGAVLPVPELPKGPAGNITNGVQPVGSKKGIAPLGDANYAFLENKVAQMHGKYGKYIMSADNPLVISSDEELRRLAVEAGLPNPEIKTLMEKETAENVAMLREFIEKTLGHDGVIVRFDNYKPTDLLREYFEYEQFINFNKANFKRTKGSGLQKTTKGTRAKKAQRQIMNVIEPPKNKTEIDEMVELRRRLRETNKLIKEGKRIGAAETRKYVTARLRNSFLIITDNMKRNSELMRLRQRIIDREKDLIKQDLVFYAKATLPTTENAEFLRERGKLISRISNAKTRLDLYKAMGAIDMMRETVERRTLMKEIAGIYKKTIKSPSVSADYRTMARAFMADLSRDVDFTKLAGKRREQVEKMKQWVERQRDLGEDVTLTEEMIKQMERLNKKPLSEMSVAEVKNIRDQLIIIQQVGKAKKRIREALINAKIEKGTEEVMNDLRQKNMWEMIRHPDEKQLTKKEKFYNMLRQVHNWHKLTDAGITPPDTLFDLMGSGTARYDEGPYRYFKAVHDQNWSEMANEVSEAVTQIQESLVSNNIKPENNVRIFAATVRRQGEDVIERAVNAGIDENFIRTVKLTDAEEAHLAVLDEWLERLKPSVRKAGIELYNREFKEVENYFPILMDFERSKDIDMLERFGNVAPQVQAKKSKTAIGATIERIKGAETPIVTDATYIVTQHIKNALYVKHMAEDIYISARIAKSKEFKEAAGTLNTYLAQEYMDLLARMGGAAGQDSIWIADMLNRNVGVAILGYKLSSALIQLSAIPQGAALVGGARMGKGLQEFASSKAIRDFVMENMPEIRNSVGDDIAFLDKPTLNELEALQNGGYWMLKKLDGVSRGATGWAAYMKYLDENKIAFDINKPNKEALAYAQRMTRLTQSSSLFKDAPMAMTKGMGVLGSRTGNRLVLKFQTFPLYAWALATKTAPAMIRGGQSSRAAWAYFWTMMAIMAEVYLIQSARDGQNWLTGKTDEEDESFASKTVDNMISRVPFVGSVVGAVTYDSVPIAAWKGFDDIFTGLGSIDLGDGELTDAEKKAYLRIATGVGTLFGFPGMLQTNQMGRDFIDASDGSTVDPNKPEAPEKPEKPERPERPPRP